MNRHHYEYKTYYPDTKGCLNYRNSPTAISRLTRPQKVAPPLVPGTRSGQFKLFAFMCRWTCSRCWRLAESLGQMQEWFADRGLAVVLVGQGHYLQPATRLAADLHLPFKLISDECRALRRLYGLEKCTTLSHQRTVVLTDKKGRVKYWQHSMSTDGKKHLNALLATIEYHADN